MMKLGRDPVEVEQRGVMLVVTNCPPFCRPVPRPQVSSVLTIRLALRQPFRP